MMSQVVVTVLTGLAALAGGFSGVSGIVKIRHWRTQYASWAGSYNDIKRALKGPPPVPATVPEVVVALVAVALGTAASMVGTWWCG